MQGPICASQVVVEGSHVLFQSDRPLNVLDGSLVLADLVGNHAEKMDGVGVIRLGGENLPIDLLGSLQPAALMVLDGSRQSFGNRCHEAYYGKMICQPQCIAREPTHRRNWAAERGSRINSAQIGDEKHAIRAEFRAQTKNRSRSSYPSHDSYSARHPSRRLWPVVALDNTPKHPG